MKSDLKISTFPVFCLQGKSFFEERKLDPIEIPCRDLDEDCIGEEKPFGSYHKCYLYAPELGRCPLLTLEIRG